MTLTPEEKAAGREFRSDCITEQLKTAHHFDATGFPAQVGGYRHICEGAGKGRLASAKGRTVLLALEPREKRQAPFTWAWREGRCKECGFSARSAGYLVVSADTEVAQ